MFLFTSYSKFRYGGLIIPYKLSQAITSTPFFLLVSLLKYSGTTVLMSMLSLYFFECGVFLFVIFKTRKYVPDHFYIFLFSSFLFSHFKTFSRRNKESVVIIVLLERNHLRKSRVTQEPINLS